MATAATRIIALGSVPLMDGFRLAGVEVVPDADAQQLESLLKSLVMEKAKALILVESGLIDEPGQWLHHVQSEGGRIVVVQIPSLASGGKYRSDVDALIGSRRG